jgi:peptidylprolyl isomerase
MMRVLRRAAVALCVFTLMLSVFASLPALAQGDPTATPTGIRPPFRGPYTNLPQQTTVAGFPVIGNSDTGLILVEFSNFSCPGCQQYRAVVKEIIEKYVRAGQVRLMFVPMVFDFGQHPSFIAAQAALCAGKQGGFWEMHDALFQIHAEQGPNAFTPALVIDVANRVGLDGAGVAACLNTGETANTVNQAIDYASQLRIQYTPTLMYSLDSGQTLLWFENVQGQRYDSAVPLSEIDRILAEASSGQLQARLQATATALASITPTATPIPADPFANLEYVAWQSPDGLISLEYPKAWRPQTNPDTASPVSWVFTPPDNPSLGVGLAILPIKDVGIPDLPPDTDAAKLAELVFAGQPNTEIRPVETPNFKGVGIRQKAQQQQDPNTGQVFSLERDLWFLQLDPKTIIIIQGVGPSETWDKLEPIFLKAAQTLKTDTPRVMAALERVFNPTATPTPTFDATIDTSNKATVSAFQYNRFTSPDGLVEFEAPNGWTVKPQPELGPATYQIELPNVQNNNVNLTVVPVDQLGLAEVKPDATALDLIKEVFKGDSRIVVNEVSLGQYKGGGVVQYEPFQDRATGQYQELERRLWAVNLDTPVTHLILLQSVSTLEKRGQVDAVFDRVAATLKLNAPAIITQLNLRLTVTPTPSITPTPNVTPTPVTVNGLPFSPVFVGQGACVGVKDPEGVNVPPDGNTKQFTAPEQVIDLTHKYCAILTTSKGRIVIELYPQVAPAHVNSFVFLARQGFYDNTVWHRVIPGFVAQGGDPTGTGTGGPGYTLPLEVNSAAKYDRIGVLGMARANDPNSAGSQFFITYDVLPNLDPGPNGPGYTIFGQVVEGMEVAVQLTAREPGEPTAPDKLISVRIVDLGAQ